MNKTLISQLTNIVISTINNQIDEFNKELFNSEMWSIRSNELDTENSAILVLNTNINSLKEIKEEYINDSYEYRTLVSSITELESYKDSLKNKILRKEFGILDEIRTWEDGGIYNKLQAKLGLISDEVVYDYNELVDNLIVWAKKEEEIYI